MLFRITLLATLLALLAQSPNTRAPEWKSITPPIETTFPRDHGAHVDCRTEWWYATGTLKSAAGADTFGWQLTIFRQGLQPGEAPVDSAQLAPRQIYAGHFALVDFASGRLVHAERVRRAMPGLASASATDLDLALDGWTLRRNADDTVHAVAIDRDLDITIDLTLRPSKPAIMHGLEGVSAKGAQAGNASAYMSWTRLATQGSLTLGGQEHTVSGESWFDHEWGSTMIAPGVVGWDWFGLRFDDGRELMLYRLRRADGSAIPESSATLVERDGTKKHLKLGEFALEATARWTSARSRGVYPARWHLTVPSAAIDVLITSSVANCEIDGRASTNTIYWEGPVRVEGSASGAGYGELTGYAESMAARF